MPNYDVLAAIAIAGGTRDPVLYEQMNNYVFGTQIAANDPVHHQIQDQADVNGVGAAFVANGAVSARDLEIVGEKVLTYPYTRSDTGVLDVPTS